MAFGRRENRIQCRQKFIVLIVHAASVHQGEPQIAWPDVEPIQPFDSGDFVHVIERLSGLDHRQRHDLWMKRRERRNIAAQYIEMAIKRRIGLQVHNALNARYRDYTSLLRYYADQPGRDVRIRLGTSF